MIRGLVVYSVRITGALLLGSVLLGSMSQVGFGQNALPQVRIQAFALKAAANVVQPNDRDTVARKWVRGLIQQELYAIHTVCKLNPVQSKELVDMVESQWKTKLASTFRTYNEGNQRAGVDFEYRVENTVKAWLRSAQSISEQQKSEWDYEIESRNALRRRMVIGKMVSEAERKYGLTSQQMTKVESLLQERWKEAWWVMYRNGTTPETKFAWISEAMSESQRTAGGDTGSSRQEYYTSGGSVDLPSKPLTERFEIGGIASDASIPLESKPAVEKTP